MTADIDGGDAGWRGDGDVFTGILHKILQKDGLTGASFAGNKIILVGFVEEAKNGGLFCTKIEIHGDIITTYKKAEKLATGASF